MGGATTVKERRHQEANRGQCMGRLCERRGMRGMRAWRGGARRRTLGLGEQDKLVGSCQLMLFLVVQKLKPVTRHI